MKGLDIRVRPQPAYQSRRSFPLPNEKPKKKKTWREASCSSSFFLSSYRAVCCRWCTADRGAPTTARGEAAVAVAAAGPTWFSHLVRDDDDDVVDDDGDDDGDGIFVSLGRCSGSCWPDTHYNSLPALLLQCRHRKRKTKRWPGGDHELYDDSRLVAVVAHMCDVVVVAAVVVVVAGALFSVD